MHLQASHGPLQVSREAPEGDLRGKSSQLRPTAQTPAKPELVSGSFALATKLARAAPQQSSSGVKPRSAAAAVPQPHSPSAGEAPEVMPVSAC